MPRATPPIDTPEVNQWQNEVILPKNTEDEIRLRLLETTESHQLSGGLVKPNILRDFIGQIIADSSASDINGEKPADPDLYAKNIDMLMQLLETDPEVVDFNGKKCWSVSIPKIHPENDVHFITAMFDILSAGNYIVVSDENKNSQLSSLIFTNKDLIGYMIAKKIQDIQLKLKVQLAELVRNVTDKTKEIVKKINDPVRIGFFNRLLKDCDKQAIEIIKILRDRKDVAVFNGESQFDSNQRGKEREEFHFIVEKGYSDSLEFTWNVVRSELRTVIKDGRKIIELVDSSHQSRVFVRNNNGVLEYSNSGSDVQNKQWNANPDGNASQIYRLFESIGLVSVEQWGELEKNQTQHLTETAKALNTSATSVDYANKFREFRISNYPTVEIIVNPSKKVNYVIDSQTPIPSPAVVTAN